MSRIITNVTEAQETLKELFEESEYAVFFGGAGVSVASGIPDFRGVDGLYRQKWRYPPEHILSHAFFEHHPQEFFSFYKEKMLVRDAQPNTVHNTLAQLEQEHMLMSVITQNIDGLHQKAGSYNVRELHGSIHSNTCTGCGRHYLLEEMDFTGPVPYCPNCDSIIKPDVVLYGEPLDYDVWNAAQMDVTLADTLVVAGTSLVVSPAADLVNYFEGKNLVICNLTECEQDILADAIIRIPVEKAFDFEI